MTRKPETSRYYDRYVAPGFERVGLFRLIQQEFDPKEVLYPGCSVHITPAFYFPHVVFVDQDPEVQAFFSDSESIGNLVNRHRTYERNPYTQFFCQDFTQPLPVPTDQFDLLLALFAGNVSRSCRNYLRHGGLLLTNNHQGDGQAAGRDSELSLIAVIRMHQGRYQLGPAEPQDLLADGRRHGTRNRRYLMESSRGVEYVERECYYLFRRVRAWR